MCKAILLAALCVLPGCGGPAKGPFDSEDNLDCAMLFLHAEQNEKNVKTTEQMRIIIYIMRQWYFKDLTSSHVDDGMKVVEEIRQHRNEFPAALSACGKRAIADPEFDQFSKLAERTFESQTN
jgi:hypothetical protein